MLNRHTGIFYAVATGSDMIPIRPAFLDVSRAVNM